MKRVREKKSPEIDRKIKNGVQKYLENPENLLYFSTTERKEVFESNIKNPLMYDDEYFDLYSKEITYRNVSGYDYLKNITDKFIPTCYFDDRGQYKNRLLSFSGYKEMDEEKMNMLYFPKNVFNISKFKDDYYFGIQKNHDMYGLYINNVFQDFIIVDIISSFLGEYKDFVCFAGGFALSYNFFKNYGIKFQYSDIDIFIHSCDEIIATMKL